jgi:hypothetical protein
MAKPSVLEWIGAVQKLAGFLATAHETNRKAARQIEEGDRELRQMVGQLTDLLEAANAEIPDEYCNCCWPEARCKMLTPEQCKAIPGGMCVGTEPVPGS